MFDFILEFTVDLNKEALDSLNHIFQDPLYPSYWTATFKKHSFAPGVWAGTEGYVLTLGDSKFKIVEVVFEENQLRLEKLK